MARIPGVQIEKDSKGKPAYARISLKKYGKELEPFLAGIGAIEEDEFEKEWAKGGMTVEEFSLEMDKRISKWDWK